MKNISSCPIKASILVYLLSWNILMVLHFTVSILWESDVCLFAQRKLSISNYQHLISHLHLFWGCTPCLVPQHCYQAVQKLYLTVPKSMMNKGCKEYNSPSVLPLLLLVLNVPEQNHSYFQHVLCTSQGKLLLPPAQTWE